MSLPPEETPVNRYLPSPPAAQAPEVTGEFGNNYRRATPASVGRRALAFLLDFFLTSVVVIVVFIFGIPLPVSGWVSSYFLVPTLAIVISTILVATVGSTFGQRMLHLRVVDAESSEYVSGGRAVIRTIIIIAPLLALVLIFGVAPYLRLPIGPVALFWLLPVTWLVMLLIAASSPRGALHDWATRSTVMRVE